MFIKFLIKIMSQHPFSFLFVYCYFHILLFILTQKKLVVIHYKLRLYGTTLRVVLEHYSFHKKVKGHKEHNGSERCDNEFVFLSLFHVILLVLLQVQGGSRCKACIRFLQVGRNIYRS